VLLVIVIGLTLLAAMGWYLTWMQRAVISLQQEVIEELRRDMRGLEERIGIWSYLEGNAVALPPRDRKRLASLIHRESRRYAIEWRLLVAIVEMESNFKPGAESRRGALGLMQLRPSTAAEVASAIGVPYGGPVELYDIEANIRLGTAYLHMLRRRFGSLDLAVQAYHIGPTRLSRLTTFRGRAGGASSARMDRPSERVGTGYAGAVLSRSARLTLPVRIPSERAERARAAGHSAGGVGGSAAAGSVKREA
jgi:soluble lytic murein transglycosylase-like protein